MAAGDMLAPLTGRNLEWIVSPRSEALEGVGLNDVREVFSEQITGDEVMSIDAGANRDPPFWCHRVDSK